MARAIDDEPRSGVHEAQAIDDRGLAGVRGRGSDGAALAAGAAVAVILWDEKRCCAPSRGSLHPAAAGGGNVVLHAGSRGARP